VPGKLSKRESPEIFEILRAKETHLLFPFFFATADLLILFSNYSLPMILCVSNFLKYTGENSLCFLQPLAGLWIVEGKEMFYNQLSHVTFMCPMKFNKFPLDR
jgi:hypothetical protein